ncbi:MAG: CBS domain-containing protein, partial [Fimbriimonadales bacterium]
MASLAILSSYLPARFSVIVNPGHLGRDAQSIYTLKLARRGHDIPDALQANFYHLKKMREIMDTRFVAVPADGRLDDFVRIASERPEVSCFLVEGPDGLVGFLTRDSALRPAGRLGQAVTLGDLADRRFVTVGEDAHLL